jgi:hypothetical protein
VRKPAHERERGLQGSRMDPAPAAKAAGTAYEFSPGQTLRTPAFYFMWIAYALGTSAGLMVISQRVPFAGVPLALATTGIFIGAAGNAAGRILSGWLSDALGRLNVLRLMIAISAVAMLILPHTGGIVAVPVFMYVVIFVYRCYGTQLSVNASTTSDVWGGKNAPQLRLAIHRLGSRWDHWAEDWRRTVRPVQGLPGCVYLGGRASGSCSALRTGSQTPSRTGRLGWQERRCQRWPSFAVAGESQDGSL